MAGRRLDVLALTAAEKSDLMAMAWRPKTAQAMAQRARIVLTCADGLENKAVARLLDVHAMTVGKWRRRFLAQQDRCWDGAKERPFARHRGARDNRQDSHDD